MKMTELVAFIKTENPELLDNIPNNRAAALIRQVFSRLAKTLEEQEEGLVKVPGFGSFRIRMVETEKDSQKSTVKRILFRPAKPAPEKSAKNKSAKNKSEKPER